MNPGSNRRSTPLDMNISKRGRGRSAREALIRAVYTRYAAGWASHNIFVTDGGTGRLRYLITVCQTPTAFNLPRVEGLSQQAIASRMGLSGGTLRMCCASCCEQGRDERHNFE